MFFIHIPHQMDILLPAVPSLSGESFTMLNGVQGPGASIQRECAVPFHLRRR